MVCVNNFSISFGDTQILENINFQVKEGEIVTLLGQSGCGKTTILRSIAGLQREHGGNICIGDTCVSSKEVYEKKREVGYIFQDYALFPHLDVEDNIAFALDKLKRKEKEKRVLELLEQFDIVNHRKKQIHQLSGGQQQRVAIARAMANKPKILLLDEPFANLDSILRNKTKMWLKKLIKENNLSAILVTHDKKEALSISDKIGIIHNKELLQFENTQEIYNKPRNFFVAKFLSEINVIPQNIMKKLVQKIDEKQKAIININDTHISTNESNFKIDIIESLYCGDYFEIIFTFENETQELVTRSKIEISQNKDYYIDLNIDKIKILDT